MEPLSHQVYYLHHDHHIDSKSSRILVDDDHQHDHIVHNHHHHYNGQYSTGCSTSSSVEKRCFVICEQFGINNKSWSPSSSSSLSYWNYIPKPPNQRRTNFSYIILLLLISTILILTPSSNNNNNLLVECSSITSIVPYLYSKLSSSNINPFNFNFNNNNDDHSQLLKQRDSSTTTGFDCSYFSNTNNNNLESCNSLPGEQSPFSTFTIRLTGGTDAIYGKAYPPIIFPLSKSSSSSIKLFNDDDRRSSTIGDDTKSRLIDYSSPSTATTTVIPNNETSYCYQVQQWLDQQQQPPSNNNYYSQIPNLCSQFFCNPKDSQHLMIVQEIFSNLSKSLSENSYFPSVVTPQFSIKLTLENSTTNFPPMSNAINYGNSNNMDPEPTTDWITMTISQLTKLYNYCHYCSVGNPSFELFKKEREDGMCSLPFSMNSLNSGRPSVNDGTNVSVLDSTGGSSTSDDDDICGQKGNSLPLLNTMTYASLNDHRLLYYFPYKVCYCHSSSSFASKCDEWSDLYYTSDFQNGIRGMFIGLYVIQLLLIVAIVLIPLMYKHVRLGTRSSLARITTDTSSTQDLQGKLTFDENSYSFKLVSESSKKTSLNKQRSRSNSPSVLPTLDNPSSDSEDTLSASIYYRYENAAQPSIAASHTTTEVDVKKDSADCDNTPLLKPSNDPNRRERKRKTQWNRVFKSLLKSIFDFRIIATIVSITNLMAGFLSLIPTLPYDARLVLISITCVLSLMGLIPIVFQWLVVLRKIDSQDPTSHSGRHIKALSIVVFTSTIMLFIGYMLTVIFVSGYSSVLLARYIMLVVLFLYFIICFPLLVGYGIKVYFRVLKNNNEIRFFQFKFTKYLLFESLTYLYFTAYTVYFIVSYPYFLSTFNNIGDRFMTVYPWSITHVFIILSHCNRFYFLSDTSYIKLFYMKYLCCCLGKKGRPRSSTKSSASSSQHQSKVQHYESTDITTPPTTRKISSASTSSSVHDDSSISF